MDPFFEVRAVPTNSCVLLETAEEAAGYPRGDIVLALCRACGHISNVAFDPRLAVYSVRYEGTQAYSPTFAAFQRGLARDLVERNEIRDKDVLEIGCGNGELLALLCRLGGNRGLGFDPSYHESRGFLEDLPGVRVVRGFFSAADDDVKADLVCSSMTLEHIPETGAFLRLLGGALRRPGPSLLFLMVPNAMRILRERAFEDIYYEHCSYFTAGSLARLLRTQGLRVLRVETKYDDQYLAIEGTVRDQPDTFDDATGPLVDSQEVRTTVASFEKGVAVRVREWQTFLEARRGARIALWGSGSKAVAFLSAVGTSGGVDRVIDVNPHKEGYYLPGSARPIVSPASLVGKPPDTVVVMNRVYLDEVSAQLESLGLEPELAAL